MNASFGAEEQIIPQINSLLGDPIISIHLLSKKFTEWPCFTRHLEGSAV